MSLEGREFCLGHIKFEMPIRHTDGEARKADNRNIWAQCSSQGWSHPLGISSDGQPITSRRAGLRTESCTDSSSKRRAQDKEDGGGGAAAREPEESPESPDWDWSYRPRMPCLGDLGRWENHHGMVLWLWSIEENIEKVLNFLSPSPTVPPLSIPEHIMQKR